MVLNQKICVISFDHWNYDRHIVLELQKQGIEANHIKIGNFKHKNLFERFKNSLSKIFLNVNPKLKKRQDFIIELLEKYGSQDQILVINPELIDQKYHLEIKKHTKKYIAYLYDSVSRCPVEHLLNGIFDEIFSFDNDDILKYNFKKTTNYIYLEKQELNNIKPKFDLFYLASYDKRFNFLKDLSKKSDEIKIDYLFLIIGKKLWLKSIISSIYLKKSGLKYQIKRVNQAELIEKYSISNCILDLVRDNQTGLSFRIFEAMALQKKIVTDNQSIKSYDFYNPTNILVIDKKNFNIENDFFNNAYIPIPKEIYNNYTIKSWVKNVFEI